MMSISNLDFFCTFFKISSINMNPLFAHATSDAWLYAYMSFNIIYQQHTDGILTGLGGGTNMTQFLKWANN